MSSKLSKAVKQFVYERANGCCEYCRTCEVNTGQTMQIDHIDTHGGDDTANLCLSCWNCNNYKRAVIAVSDVKTGEVVPLYHPRRQRWDDHFAWSENFTQIRGITPTGRVTIVQLKMNRTEIIRARLRWVQGGYHPPPIH